MNKIAIRSCAATLSVALCASTAFAALDDGKLLEESALELRARAAACDASTCRVRVYVSRLGGTCYYSTDDVEIAAGKNPTIVWVLKTNNTKYRFSLPGVVVIPAAGYTGSAGASSQEYRIKDEGKVTGFATLSFNITYEDTPCVSLFDSWNPYINNK